MNTYRAVEGTSALKNNHARVNSSRMGSRTKHTVVSKRKPFHLDQYCVEEVLSCKEGLLVASSRMEAHKCAIIVALGFVVTACTMILLAL